MTRNQLLLWKAIILFCFVVGATFVLLTLLSGNVRALAIGVVLIVFATGLSLMLRQESKRAGTRR